MKKLLLLTGIALSLVASNAQAKGGGHTMSRAEIAARAAAEATANYDLRRCVEKAFEADRGIYFDNVSLTMSTEEGLYSSCLVLRNQRTVSAGNAILSLPQWYADYLPILVALLLMIETFRLIGWARRRKS